MKGSCHCGTVRFEVARPPEQVTECNCSLCRRLGGLFAYYPLEDFRIESGADNLGDYIQGDRMLTTRFCRTCASVTHWEGMPGTEAGPDGRNPRVGVNTRMLEDFDPGSVPLRKVDGASF